MNDGAATADERRALSSAARAGVAYFGIIFAAGFLLGILRVLILVPWSGELYAVLFELPVILILSWIVSRRLIARLSVPQKVVARLVMGGLAFCLLMLAEIGVSTLAFGQPLSDFSARYQSASAQLGLAGQVLFALFPVIQLAADR